MFMIGKNLVSSTDVMQIISVDEILKYIKEERGELYDTICQLSAIKLVDAQHYRKLKTQLPYFVCGLFRAGIRKKENFAYTQSFILDIDNISKSENELISLKNKLIKDPRVMLLFISPSQDGLKVIFKLANKISDSNYYSIFYKKFAYAFAEEYNLYGLIDVKTNDVSRCCFLSTDKDVYYNKNTLDINPKLYVDEDNYQQELNKMKLIFEQKTNNFPINDTKKFQPTAEPGKDILQQIRERINPLKIKSEKIIYQPEALERDWHKMENLLTEYNLTIDTINKISYGKQIKIKVGNEWAEVNIFYGKRGYSFVATTKTGSNSELAQMVVTLLQTSFN